MLITNFVYQLTSNNLNKVIINYNYQGGGKLDKDREDLLKSTIICNETGNSDGIRKCFDKVLVERDIKKKSR